MAETNKTEKATPKKRRDERKKGNSFQSKDVVSVVILLVGFFILSKLGGFIVAQIRELYQGQMVLIANLNDLTVATCTQLFRLAAQTFFLSTFPILIVLAFTGFIMSGIQTKFLFSTELLKFKFNRIDIIQGFKRLLSLRSVVQLVKSLLKVIVILWIIYTNLEGLLVITPDILNTPIENNLSFLLERIMSMVYKVCILFVFIAVLDYAYQKYEYEKKLRMTKQEIKDEYKQTEGDPLTKGRIREKQRKFSMNRMIQQVQHADVIVRNPTHFAIALKYDLDKDLAPLVLAKGQDHIARRIIEAGEKHHVLITENKPLARGLYENVEVNDFIPPEFYQAVAEIMAWVFSQKDKDKE